MNSTLNSFKEQQSQLIALLDKLSAFLSQGYDVGVDIEPSLVTKLAKAKIHVTNDKLKVALIGGFSEGKTSIASAWMEKLDKSSMNISHQESSNEVKVYDIENDFVLVDTPGLFGFKEQINADTNLVEKYKDITKKHVSEAHLVLYVMNSTNPIKESHQEDLQWLFRTLDLLPRTVFVLSRFDEVADVEDEEDYNENLEIKRGNVQGRLSDMLSLSKRELDDLSIVAVAANPFEQGMEYWLNNREEFKALSHISKLQDATERKIQSQGGFESLAIEMQTSVIRDVMNKQLPIAVEADNKVSEEVTKLEMLDSRLRDQLAQTNQEIGETQVRLRQFVTQYFSDLILQVKGCSLDTFGEFYEREIGSEGVILASNLQNEFSRQMSSINLDIERMQIGFDNEVNHFNTTLKLLGSQGMKHTLSGNLINANTVLSARDGVVSVAKTFGFDIAKHMKFKPWGAVNMAKGVNGALVIIGVAIEVWDSYEQYKREEKFKETIKQMVSNFELQRKDLLNIINAEEFKDNFFSEYVLLKQRVDELGENLTQNKLQQQLFHSWKVQAENLNKELQSLSSLEA